MPDWTAMLSPAVTLFVAAGGWWIATRKGWITKREAISAAIVRADVERDKMLWEVNRELLDRWKQELEDVDARQDAQIQLLKLHNEECEKMNIVLQKDLEATRAKVEENATLLPDVIAAFREQAAANKDFLRALRDETRTIVAETIREVMRGGLK